MKINYTFIIPHKNSPRYLDRCLKSIPQRDDLEVIVVDDNSDDLECVRKVIESFSSVRLYTNEGYGAGGARNTGIKRAEGEWLLFADCDDYYENSFLDVLDHYKDSDADVVYFGFLITDEKERPLDFKIEKYIDDYDGATESLDLIRYRINAPWCKMVRTDFRDEYDCLFEEQPIGNDIFFSLQVGYFARKIYVEKSKLYHYVYYKKSLTRKRWTTEKIQSLNTSILKRGAFFEMIGYKKWAKTKGWLYIFYSIVKTGNLEYICKSLKVIIKKRKEMEDEKNRYVLGIKSKVTLK